MEASQVLHTYEYMGALPIHMHPNNDGENLMIEVKNSFLLAITREHGYKLYDPRNELIVIRDVQFDEDKTWEWKAQGD